MDIIGYFGENLQRLGLSLLSPSGGLSLLTLGCAFLLAMCYLVFRRGLRKPTRFRALLRALFPRHIWRSPSTMLDFKYVAANTLLFTGLVPVMVMSALAVQTLMLAFLEAALGTASPTTLPHGLCVTLLTIGVYLAYEIAYWVDHYLSHKLPFLWEFHKVHHSAKVLTPFTNWRVHIVDSIVFLNCIALFTGAVYGIANYAFGTAYTPLTFAGTNIILLAYTYLLQHLQHTHLWIAFSGKWGRVFLSPAHHQIHHSNTPEHYDKNFGAALAVWDWMFGTLCIPEKKRQKLTFGVTGDRHLQSFTASTFHPFLHSARQIRRMATRKKPARAAAQPENPQPAVLDEAALQ